MEGRVGKGREGECPLDLNHGDATACMELRTVDPLPHAKFHLYRYCGVGLRLLKRQYLEFCP